MGWTYNTVNPDAITTGPMITGVATALTTISFIAVCLRLYVRLRIIKAPGYEDWVIVATWFMAAGFATITILQTKWGLGLEDKDDLPFENLYNFGLLQYMGAPFYITSILGFKIALLISYLRFLPAGRWRYVTITTIIACILFHVCFLIVQINLCQPVAKQWDPALAQIGTCLAGVPVYTTMASVTICFDVVIMLLPFPVLMESRIQNRKKVVLLGLFGLGIFITVIQIIRIQTVRRLVDPTDSAPLILWSSVENNLGIIVATIPTLAPLIKYFNERSRHGVSSNTASKKTGFTGYAGDVGSRYAAQTWQSRKGVYPLESINDDTETGSFEGKQNSKEFILGELTASGGPTATGMPHDSNVTQAEGVITRKTEVVVTYNNK